MGKTLFWYLFKDLVRIFLVSAVVLAGIMSFGGLLRPLTRNGLDAMQVAEMWLYLMPAMMTYSMPIAAVFAASIVYGRLTADNELTACRAAGMSYRSVCAPALSLGMVAALCSLLFLSYVVPFFSYQVERVLYENVAKVIASEIQRTHAFTQGKGKPSIFAQEAYIPPESGQNGEQIVVLRQPVITTTREDPERPELGKTIPSVFSMASKATLYIRQGRGDEVEISGVLENATRFPRALGGGAEVGLKRSEFGPITYPSLLRQNAKFMDIGRLKQLAAEPERAYRVERVMKSYIEAEQRQVLYQRIAEALAYRPEVGFVIEAAEPRQIIAPVGSHIGGEERGFVVKAPQGKTVKLVIRRPAGRPIRVFEAAELVINAEMDNEYQVVIYTLNMRDVLIPSDDHVVRKSSETQVSTVPMPEELKQYRKRTVAEYLSPESPLPGEKRDLLREKIIATNEVYAEMHSRASVGLSCLVLVMVGAVLGMQFRSGDFLSAFAVSVIPALVTVTLVVAGSQSAGQVPKNLDNPIVLAISLIWLGNVVAGMLAAYLYMRIRRT